MALLLLVLLLLLPLSVQASMLRRPPLTAIISKEIASSIGIDPSVCSTTTGCPSLLSATSSSAHISKTRSTLLLSLLKDFRLEASVSSCSRQ
jgi:hypothetical protein